MKFLNNIHNKVLKKIIQSVLVFFIFFFLTVMPVGADLVRYSDFDFDEFAEQTKDYWVHACSGTDEEVKKCLDKIIKKQREFYTQLYKLLASKQKKGLYIDDATIITTIFFEYELSFFNDNAGSYNIDDDGDDGDNETAKYFDDEVDTLKVLINAMIGYERVCYGHTTPIEIVDSEGFVGYQCEIEGSYLERDGNNPVCTGVVFTESLSFLNKFVLLMQKFFGGLPFFGVKSRRYRNCEKEALDAGYEWSDPKKDDYISPDKRVIESGYWEFLEEGNYFDRRPFLKHRYTALLQKLGLEEVSQIDTEEHREELEEIRRQIIKEIKQLLNQYYDTHGGPGIGIGSSNKNFWWPIGSTEVTSEGGKLFASGDPVSVGITSGFGMRVHPITGVESKHSGIDLAGSGGLGKTNIIAAASGTVTAVNTGCTSDSKKDSNCGGEYGNYVQIQHIDGLTTVYAHLYEGSITVKVGDSVSQGQVIAKMGSSGMSTGSHLHFEVRTGSSQDTAVDPLNYIDQSTPRPSTLSNLGDLVAMVIGFEGTGPVSGNSYVVYCNSGDVPTVGPGVTLRDNASDFASLGYPLNGSGTYSNYCGKTIPINVVDQVFAIEVGKWGDYVRGSLSSAGISLQGHQIDALTDLCYNAGNRMPDFIAQYRTYGASPSLCSNWWNHYYIKDGNGTTLPGLITRRTKECNLFLNGIYDGSY